MAFLTPAEILICQNLILNEAVEAVEVVAVDCKIAEIAAQVAARELQLAFIRYRQAQNKLAQARTRKLLLN